MQMSLFDHVCDAYAKAPDNRMSNEDLYETVARKANLSADAVQAREPVGESGQRHNLFHRQIRWYQQTLKRNGWLKRHSERGMWELTGTGKIQLRKVKPKLTLVAFSTRLGVALWSRVEDAFSAPLDVPISLAITSVPYVLRKPRAYGGPQAHEYVDFIVRAMEPMVKNLRDGASICLNIGNDSFEPGSPARGLYRERLVIALHDRLGLSLMDTLIWNQIDRAPGPIQWASKQRVQLNYGYEPIVWLTNNPSKVRSDNRRVLQPHTERHLALIAAGGEKRTASYADDSHTIRASAFGKRTPGRIPRNVLNFAHNCKEHSHYRKRTRQLGLPVHGAMFPPALVKFLIEFLSEPGELVVDGFAGSLTTAAVAESLGRLWMASETIWEYIRGGAERFDPDSIEWNPYFLAAA